MKRATERELLPVPGIVLGAYPERRRADQGVRVGIASRGRALLAPREAGHRYDAFLARVESLDSSLGALSPEAYGYRISAARANMARDGLTDDTIAEAFVLIKRACARELGIELFAKQLLAARIMLDRQLAEMATGEGKTLAAGVCAAAAALAGIPVHLITANEYLVKRDAELLKPIYAAMGLTVGAITQDLDSAARHAAYDRDIVYCTAAELVFDYLRDGLVRDRLRGDLQPRIVALRTGALPARATLLRGLCMAIVDEADSILIDEARTPLILSERRSNEHEQRYLRGALDAAGRLTADTHFVLHARSMSVELTAAGRQHLDELATPGAWKNRMHRDETVCTALAALHLYEKDRHYLVRDGAVAIIDEATGRLAPGRVWSRGLHRLIELKEGCAAGGDTATVAQITYQRFFQRYLALGGMSGTLDEARDELLAVYGLPVVKVPLRRRDRRVVFPTRLFSDREAQWNAVVAQAIEASRRGQPVLIGTDCVADSDVLSKRLTDAGADHAVLNARQDSDEAQVIAGAGQMGRITVATNMAGRGTDIALGRGVAELGGLHVISCQHNASRRIDRQLIGRCARQGDPGSTETLLALDQPLIARLVPAWMRCRVSARGFDAPQWLVRTLVRIPQWIEENRQRAQRRNLLRQDVRAAKGLSFGRPME